MISPSNFDYDIIGGQIRGNQLPEAAFIPIARPSLLANVAEAGKIRHANPTASAAKRGSPSSASPKIEIIYP